MSHLRAAWRCVLIFLHVQRGWWQVWRQNGSWTPEQQAQVVELPLHLLRQDTKKFLILKH